MRVLIAVLLAVALPAAARSQEHMTPDNTVFSKMAFGGSYEPFLPLRQVLNSDVSAVAVIGASYALEKEFMIGIRRSGSRHRLFGAKAALNEKGERLLQGGGTEKLQSRMEPSRRTDVKLETCEIPIEEKFALQLIDAWKIVLGQTRYDDTRMPNIQPDGWSGHFAVRGRHHVMAGMMWMPVSGTNPARLWSIAEVLRDACESGSIKSENRRGIEKMIRAID